MWYIKAKMSNIDEVLSRGVEEILPSKKDLVTLLNKRKITIYQGFDPTAPSLHIGHFIGIRKLAQFQKLGHKVIFLIGDFTGLIGDPTDKSAARVTQTREQVLENLKNYKKQASKILDFEGPNKAEVLFNSEWLGKLSFEEIIKLSANFTVQQMIERDMFQKRIKESKPIYLHEFLYPLMQGYDSVAMTKGGVDMEIGGSDQLFNMLAGRTLMNSLENKEKFVLSMKLLTDENGKKMGKSEGNAVFLSDKPVEMFGKLMSWPDSFLSAGIESLTDLDPNIIIKFGPFEAKKMVAFQVVKQAHGEKEAQLALESFEKTFIEKEPDFETAPISGMVLSQALALFNSKKSVSEAKRLIKQGAVDINGVLVQDTNYTVKTGDKIKVGKKTFLKAK